MLFDPLAAYALSLTVLVISSMLALYMDDKRDWELFQFVAIISMMASAAGTVVSAALWLGEHIK